MVRNIVVKILKRLGMYGMANTGLIKWRSTPWGRLQRMRALLSFYGRFIGNGDMCFDVGANVGERTEVFRRLGATVVAVEPQDCCVQQLAKKYEGDSKVKIVQKALGAKEGELQMMTSNCPFVSSLSREWINRVKGKGAMTKFNWDTGVIVPVTTLDRLIEEYGQPAFCKIDVEGFEFEVLKGLSRPIRVVSIEFTPEFLDPAIDSINRLSSLGMIWFNYAVGEWMNLRLAKWVKADEIADVIRALPDIGDVYATSAPVPRV